MAPDLAPSTLPQPPAAQPDGDGSDDLEVWSSAARAWLEERLARMPSDREAVWGDGSDDVSVFHDLTFGEEHALLERNMAWQREKFDAGYAAITWSPHWGGAGLSAAHERAYREIESQFVVPDGHETFSVTVGLVAPTVDAFGTPGQKERFIKPFLRTEVLCCQLFSEPGAGSDLASLSTRAVRQDDGDWIVRGQKVWSSGAQYSGWGELIARSEPDGPRHAGMTAFLVPMDAPGVQVRPIRQMSGGSSFNEVFLDDVRLSDDLRLGPVGDGWKVALTTLGHERAGSGSGRAIGGSWPRLLGLARWLGVQDDPLVRQDLARIYGLQRLRAITADRVQSATRAGQTPGPAGSVGKLAWTQSMQAISDLASRLLGPRLIADTGEWGTFAWGSHVLGAPGYRIAGGSDEIQHNIIGERVLGLPREPRPRS